MHVGLSISNLVDDDHLDDGIYPQPRLDRHTDLSRLHP